MTQMNTVALMTLLFSSSAIGLYAALAHFLFSHLSKPVQDKALSIMSSVVPAVEQTAQNFSGPQKQQEALRVFNVLCDEVGLKVSPTMAQTLLEQSVYAINQLDGYSKTQVLPVAVKATANG